MLRESVRLGITCKSVVPTWHRVGRAGNWNEHDVALRGTRPCSSWEPVCVASSDVRVSGVDYWS